MSVNNYFSVGGVVRPKNHDEGSIMPEFITFDDRRPDDVVRARIEALELRDNIKTREKRLCSFAIWRRCEGAENVPVIGEGL